MGNALLTCRHVDVLVNNAASERLGCIVNVASSHGLVASIEKAAYVSAKHGLVGPTKTVALERRARR